jgi:thiol-disulfide isomerase/thioredoxin
MLRNISKASIPGQFNRNVLSRSASNFVILGDENQRKIVEDAPGKKVFYFTATWCPPCKAIAPVFKKLSEENTYKDITFLKIDIDDFTDSAAEYNVRSVPTFVFLNGKTSIAQVII